MDLAKYPKPFVDDLGRPLKHLDENVRYTFVDRKYYTAVLRPGQREEVKPELPESEARYKRKHPVEEEAWLS